MLNVERNIMKIVSRVFVIFVFTLLMATSGVKAAWQDGFKQLRVGILQSHPMAKNPDKLREFVSSYSNLLGVEVDVSTFSSLGAMIDAHASARIHYAIHTARSYATTERICNCVNAIARPISQTGAVGFRSVLISRKDVNISGDFAKANVKIGFSRKESISGWLMPNAAIENGELGKFDLIELGSVGNLIAAFEEKKIQGFFGWVPVFADETEFDQSKLFNGLYTARLDVDTDIEMAWWSGIVHHGPHAIHKSVPVELREDLTELLTNMDSQQPDLLDIIEPYFSGAFAKSDLSDYRAITAALSIKAGVAVPGAEIELSLRPTIGK